MTKVRASSAGPIEQESRTWARAQRAMQFVSPYWSRLPTVFILAVLAAVVSLSYPLLAMFFIDEVLVSRNLQLLGPGTLALAAIVLLGFLVGEVSRYLYTSVSAQILMDIRVFVFRHLQNLSPRFSSKMEPDEVMARLDGDLAMIETYATDTAYRFALNTLILTGTAAALLWLNWKLFLLTCLFLPIGVKGLTHFRRRITSRASAVRETNAGLSTVLQASGRGMKFIKACGAEEAELQKLRGRNQASIDSRLQYQVVSAFAKSVPAVLLALSTLAVLFYGGGLVIASQMSLGSLVAFAAFQGRALRPLQSLMGLHLSLQQAKVSLDRIFAFLEMTPEIKEAECPAIWEPLRGEIRFSHVTFSHGGEKGEHALRRVNLVVPGGSRVAIVGPSGAGKSTLVDLLLRFYDPDEGTVTLDGCDLREVSLKCVRSNIALVTSAPHLFHATVEENLRYANWQATAEELRAAARTAGADDFILSLPQGYQTVIGEKGAELSPGQIQRIAVARAVLRNSKILILDEATSALDVLSDSRIQEPLRGWLKGRTVFVITHRLSFVHQADQVVVLNKGEIVQVGSHIDLLGREGLYKHLYLLVHPGESAPGFMPAVV